MKYKNHDIQPVEISAGPVSNSYSDIDMHEEWCKGRKSGYNTAIDFALSLLDFCNDKEAVENIKHMLNKAKIE